VNPYAFTRGQPVTFPDGVDGLFPFYIGPGTPGVVLRDDGDLFVVALLEDASGDFDEWGGCLILDSDHPCYADARRAAVAT
jgi:hypothetical protein